MGYGGGFGVMVEGLDVNFVRGPGSGQGWIMDEGRGVRGKKRGVRVSAGANLVRGLRLRLGLALGLRARCER